MPLYRLFNHFLPSRRDNPPLSEYGLVPVLASEPGTDDDDDEREENANEDGLDVIFVHGLGSQPDWTWGAEKKREGKGGGDAAATTKRNGNHGMPRKEYVYWVKEFLIPDLAFRGVRGVRFFYYNYDSTYHRDASEKRLHDLGGQLLARISLRRQSLVAVRRFLMSLSDRLVSLIVFVVCRRNRSVESSLLGTATVVSSSNRSIALRYILLLAC